MRIDLRERIGAMVRYFVFDDDGSELRQVNRDASEEIAEARERRKSLIQILAEREGIIAPKQSESLSAAAPVALSPDTHTHVEFDQYLTGMPDHEHPLEGHEHPHAHDEIPHLVRQLGEHEHELPAHGHAAIDARLGDFAGQLTAFGEHTHAPHEHPHDHKAEFSAFYERLTALWDEMQATLQRLNDHEHAAYLRAEEPVRPHRHEGYELVGHEHETPDHEHEVPAHSHDMRNHTHPVVAHEHPYSPHAHPEIVGLFAAPGRVQEVEDAHIHRFDLMEADGKGWKCGICHMPKAEVDDGR